MSASVLERLQTFLQGSAADQGDDAADQRDLAAAALLIEVARADFEFDDSERATIETVLNDTLALERGEIAELMQRATERSEHATSLQEFTHRVHETHSLAEKKALMEQLWRVAYADGRLDRYEEQLLRRVADLIHLRHSEFMQAKAAATPDSV